MFNFFLSLFLALNFLFIILSIASLYSKMGLIVKYFDEQQKFNNDIIAVIKELNESQKHIKNRIFEMEENERLIYYLMDGCFKEIKESLAILNSNNKPVKGNKKKEKSK